MVVWTGVFRAVRFAPFSLGPKEAASARLHVSHVLQTQMKVSTGGSQPETGAAACSILYMDLGRPL